MIHMWFTDINYYKLAVEKDCDSIFRHIKYYAYLMDLLPNEQNFDLDKSR